MAAPHHFSEPAALLAFVLVPGPEWPSDILSSLQNYWGLIRHLGKLYPFDKTEYYTPEMGSGLYRGVLSFEKTVEPQEIGKEKERSNALEQTFALSAEFGVNSGKYIGEKFSPRIAEAIGGGVLILIGVKILIEHLTTEC